MRIVFLRSARSDLDWFRDYYSRIFREGGKNAATRYKATKKALAAYPAIGQESDEPGLRELPIPKTPFSIIYRITDSEIQVLRLWDQRSQRPDSWT